VGNEFACEGEHVPGPTPLRRLTLGEYATTVQAALGVDVSTELSRLPPDLRADGFSNTASGLVVDVGHVAGFAEVARLAVERVDDLGVWLDARGASCRALSEECAREVVQAAASSLFRAPAREEEVTALTPLFAAVETEGGDFLEGAGLVLEAMLQAPRFLYRVEKQDGPDPVRALDDYEVASRLSYLLWGGPPDGPLMTAAAAGELRTDAQIEAQVRRMLEEPAARETSLRYVSDWLNLSRLDNLAREEGDFPSWEPALAADMKRETLAFAERLIWQEEAPLTSLFDAQRALLTNRLAAYYGLDPQGETGDPAALAEYDLSDVPERGGLLTQGALLTVGGPSASMVHRGLFVLETVLCGHVHEPPPGVDTTPMETTPGFSRRDEAELRVNSAACGGCHSQMDTLAFGLERFDGSGAYAIEDEHGNVLRQDGFVKFPGRDEQVPYESVAELMDVLASSERVRDCMSLKASQFSLGRPLAAVDGCALASVRDRFAASDGSYQELMVAIALSPMSRTTGGER
jgi:hypothetical protein